jgi:hypothetical protein
MALDIITAAGVTTVLDFTGRIPVRFTTTRRPFITVPLRFSCSGSGFTNLNSNSRTGWPLSR